MCPHVAQCGLGRDLPPYQLGMEVGLGPGHIVPLGITKWHLDASSRLATIEMGRKLGLLCLFLGGGAAGSSPI